jgi:hypothetical protein
MVSRNRPTCTFTIFPISATRWRLLPARNTSLRELMERMGHSSSRAAMIYQHASRERDEAIAAAMGSALAGARKKAAGPSIGHAAGTRGWESIMILAEMMSMIPRSWGSGLERAKGIEPS